MLTLFGLAMFAAIYGGMLWSNSRRWRYLSRHYSSGVGAPTRSKSMQSVVLLGLGGFNSKKGIVTVGVHKDGVSLRVLPLFSLFHEPLFVPYTDIKGWATTWYLDAPSTEIELRRAPEVKLILPEELAEWIKGFSGSKMALSQKSPPQGRAGRGWYYFRVAHASFVLVSLIGLFGYLVWSGKISQVSIF